MADQRVLATVEGAPLVAMEGEASALMGVDLDLLKARVDKIHEVMDDVMVKDQHYGVIPGTGKKATLLQPGAQLLSTLFRFVAKADYTRSDLAGGHREYEFTVELYSHDGSYLGLGFGFCSTMETRYRYRTEAGEMTVVGDVPKTYWGLRESQPERAQATIGPGNRTKKIEGQWKIVHYEGGGGKVENPNIADTYNTVKKIGYKRAFVAAILNVTGASDVFTQDLEDMEATIAGAGSTTAAAAPEKEAEAEERWSAEQADVVKQIQEKTPGWIKDTSVAAKRLTAELDAVEKSDDLGGIQAVFDKWVGKVFPALERIAELPKHAAFNVKQDRKKVADAMKAVDYDPDKLTDLADLWEEQLTRRGDGVEVEDPSKTDDDDTVDLNAPE